MTHAEGEVEQAPRLAKLRDDLTVVLPAWITARLLVALGFVLADALVEHYGWASAPPARAQGLFFWDGAYYRDIATHGYGSVPGNPLRFFPLFPGLGRVLSPLAGGREDVALLVVANVAAIAAAVVLRRLAFHETGDRALADRAAWLVLLVPPAFVLSFAYSEALFLALAIGCFLFLRTQRWGSAAVCAGLAAATRPVGLLLVLPIAIEVWQQRGVLTTWARRGGAGAAIVAPMVGLGAYLAYAAWRFDDWWAPVRSQESYRGDFVDPVTRLARGVGDLVGDETFGDGLHLPFAVVGIALVVLAFRWWPLSYGAFSAALVIAALSADNLNSLERYLLAAFPLVLVLARMTGTERSERVALAVCGNGMLALTALALLGVYVP